MNLSLFNKKLLPNISLHIIIHNKQIKELIHVIKVDSVYGNTNSMYMYIKHSFLITSVHSLLYVLFYVNNKIKFVTLNIHFDFKLIALTLNAAVSKHVRNGIIIVNIKLNKQLLTQLI